MWRAIGWMLVVGLSFAVSEAAGQDSTDARKHEARTALGGSSNNNLGQFRLAQGHLAEAVQSLSQALTLSEERLRQEAPALSESRLADVLQALRADEERIYSLLRAYPDDPRVQRLAMTAVLLRKGRSLEEAASTSRLLHHGLGARDSAVPPSPAAIINRVAASLPGDSALIEFVAYVDRPLVSKPGAATSQNPGQLRYLALVLFPDARIRSIDLGAAADIDGAAMDLSEALTDRAAGYQAQAEKLYALAFQPLRPLLGNTRRIYLSLDGKLSFIPFDALHDGRRALIEAFDFSYLNSGRELLPRPTVPASSSTVAVFADPLLGSSPSTPHFPYAPLFAMARLPSLSTVLPSLRGGLTDMDWVPLPETRREAESIQRLFPQAQLFLSGEATRERLLHLQAPTVLHLATHGFFVEGEAAPQPQEAMLRSGLVLSADGKPQAKGDMVTAREMAGMDLWGTELVVLSACDTGRGDVELGQGVYGLRRALTVAGAETVVMSLWQVNDEATRLLMESYYRNLSAGQGRGEALREAMRTLRKTHPHPHDWAAFISLGRDTPLRSLGARSML